MSGGNYVNLTNGERLLQLAPQSMQDGDILDMEICYCRRLEAELGLVGMVDGEVRPVGKRHV